MKTFCRLILVVALITFFYSLIIHMCKLHEREAKTLKIVQAAHRRLAIAEAEIKEIKSDRAPCDTQNFTLEIDR